MGKNTKVLVPEKGAPFKTVEEEIPEPGNEQVLIEVKACGVCHSDHLTKDGLWPGLSFPRVCGHEVAGVVVKAGPGPRASVWNAGDRVGVGWHGGHCFTCEPCRRGDFICCLNGTVTGISYDGGYQNYMVAPAETLAKIPDEMSFVEAAPLMCAGVTVFNGMRANAKPAGSLVAVQGIGGLGHLALQFANKMGYHVVAISRGTEKKERALALGAHDYIDSKAEDVNAKLQSMGGASMIVCTGWDAKTMSDLIPGLGVGGTLVVIGAAMEPMQVPPLGILGQRKNVRGHPSGTAMDSQDTMAFAARHGVKTDLVVFPFAKAAEAYDTMMSGKYRVVIDFQA